MLLEICQGLPLNGEARRSASCPCTEPNINRFLRCRIAGQARLRQLSLGSVRRRDYPNQHCEYCHCATKFFHCLFFLLALIFVTVCLRFVSFCPRASPEPGTPLAPQACSFQSER